MLDKYAYGSNAFMLVYDVTDEQSFVELEEWLRQAKQCAKDVENPAFALIANKIDLEHMRVIKSERHHKFAVVSLDFSIKNSASMCLNRNTAC